MLVGGLCSIESNRLHFISTQCDNKSVLKINNHLVNDTHYHYTGTESTRSSNCKDTPHSFQQDLGWRTLPTDWKGHLIKISKKSDLSKCENYRGITLLSIPRKVFNKNIN
ncbi:unnamed protein product [Schistosoma curassoni]|uniref:Methylase_S domain-containing protein n=1 Tax=Schistosoma curassoni TaxID=6186 RepID=A0A183K2L3_9TREM|nr:unnamed protein product [Schistosoma curassoni]